MKTVTELAQQIADAELEACCALMDDWGLDAADLRTARRPVQPSLKEQALKALEALGPKTGNSGFALIRRALELLPEGPAVTPPAAAPDRSDRFPTPHQIAECGGPCLDGGPTACDCGLYQPPAAAPDRPLWDQMSDTMHDASSVPDAMAAALRVVADWLERMGDGTPWMEASEVFATSLRAEAERAEAGEDSMP